MEFKKQSWKPGTLIYPLPAVLVSCGATPEEYNLLTVAWTGTAPTYHINSTCSSSIYWFNPLNWRWLFYSFSSSLHAPTKS